MDGRRNPAAHLSVHGGNLLTTAMHASAHGMERKSIGTSHSSLGIEGFRTPSGRASDGRQANVFGIIAGRFELFRVSIAACHNKNILLIGSPWILELPSTYRVTAPILATLLGYRDWRGTHTYSGGTSFDERSPTHSASGKGSLGKLLSLIVSSSSTV